MEYTVREMHPNSALSPVRYALWTLRGKAAQRRQALHRPHMRTLFLAVAVSLATSSFAREPVVVDFRCLTTGETKPIQLEWRTFFEPESKWSSAYVKYKGAKQVIPLVRRSSEVTQKPAGRPWEITTLWLEVVDGRISGEYEITSQGANIYGFLYKNLRTRKEVSFLQDNEAFEESECKWN